MSKVTRTAVIDALGTATYIVAVATFLNHAQALFGNDEGKSWIIPVAMLSLLVFSVALIGFLMIGRPVLWYVDGRKKEAVALFFWTLGIFFGLTVIAFLVLASLR